MGRIWTVDGEDMFFEDVIPVMNWEVLVSRTVGKREKCT